MSANSCGDNFIYQLYYFNCYASEEVNIEH